MSAPLLGGVGVGSEFRVIQRPHPPATEFYSPAPRGEGGVRGNAARSNLNALDSSIASIPLTPTLSPRRGRIELPSPGWEV